MAQYLDTFRRRVLKSDFICPEEARIGRQALPALLTAIAKGDAAGLDAMRRSFADRAQAFDAFVMSFRSLLDGSPGPAAAGFAQIDGPEWRVAAQVFQAICLAVTGDPGQAIAIANRLRDALNQPGAEAAPNFTADQSLVTAGACYIAELEATHAPATAPVRTASIFRYLISYPRSGNTYLRQFLSYAFDAPAYSIYPNDIGRYFSHRFYDAAPGHAVFVKDHEWRDAYLQNDTLYVVRDGREAMLSYARYLYSEGSHGLVERGDFADFLAFVAEHISFGFWSDHVRAIFDARERGARVRLVRYEEIFDNFPALMALARDIAGDGPVPRQDEREFAAFVVSSKRRLATDRTWSEAIELPADSYLPVNWSIGGGTSDWRRAFDGPARQRFHELGGTEMLIRLGYETDENWWRDA